MMNSFALNSGFVFETTSTKFNDGFSQNPVFRTMGRVGGGGGGGGGGSSSSSSSSLVLDSERGELVRAPTRLGPRGGVAGEKAVAALKSHSEAERRRRERINAHLDTLRSLVPCTDKMDKASLLAEVIGHVKELKRTATDATRGLVIPMDVDEVRVEPHEDGVLGGPFSIRASLCCDDRPEILPNLKQALETCKLETVRVEISTLGGRMKNVFVITGCKQENIDDAEVRRLLMTSVYQALRSVLDRIPNASDFSPRTTLPNKRRRISLFDSSSSSS